MKTFDITKIFKNPCQHVLIWDRFNDPIHRKALELVKSFISKDTLPLLYGLGRYERDYEQINADYEKKHKNHTYAYYGEQNGNNEQRTSHMELCLQINEKQEKATWDKIVKWMNKNKHGWAWRSRLGPVWQPLGCEFSQCQYACAMDGRETRILGQLPYREVPMLLKLIWNRVTEEICNSEFIDPLDSNDNKKLRSIIKKVLQPINPKDFGLKPDKFIYPEKYVVSHLALIALDMIIDLKPVYGMGYCFGKAGTRSYFSYDLEGYMKGIIR